MSLPTNFLVAKKKVSWFYMDDRMEKTGLFYVRFMDDWIVRSPNRWKLKKAIQIVNQTLNELKVEKHPDKTFIGRRSLKASTF